MGRRELSGKVPDTLVRVVVTGAFTFVKALTCTHQMGEFYFMTNYSSLKLVFKIGMVDIISTISVDKFY